jgi:hypothetical protein
MDRASGKAFCELLRLRNLGGISNERRTISQIGFFTLFGICLAASSALADENRVRVPVAFGAG